MISFFFSMLPIYIFGNLHCAGMCGPLVMMIGQYRYRAYYFLGRLVSFTLAGMIAGGAGSVLNILLKKYHVSAFTSFAFGAVIIILGVFNLMGLHYPGHQFLAQFLSRFNRKISLLLLKDEPGPSFLFGFLTLALPCGQTLLVFSACALTGEATIGMVNGFAFALITSPSLFLAMHVRSIFPEAKKYHQQILGGLALVVGLLALLRGFAEIGYISHWILNPTHSSKYHIVIF